MKGEIRGRKKGGTDEIERLEMIWMQHQNAQYDSPSNEEVNCSKYSQTHSVALPIENLGMTDKIARV